MNVMNKILGSVMAVQNVTQTELSRITGVPQPRISAYVHGRTGLSLEMLTLLLSSLGHTVAVTISAAPADLNRSENRSWLLHRAVAAKTDASSLEAWRPLIETNINRLRTIVHGEPHETNLGRWETMVRSGDVRAWKQVLLDLGPDGVAMREVSPLSGLLTTKERSAALAGELP